MSGLVWDRIAGLRILGTRIRIQSQSREVLQQVLRQWAPFVAAGASARSLDTFSVLVDEGRMVLLHDCVQVANLSDVDHAVRTITAELNRHVIERYRGLGIHAGAVAIADGAVVFPGDSGSGKTTLTAATVRVGDFDYVSDEGLCVEVKSGLVEPYPKPLSLGPWAASRLGIPASVEMPTRGDHEIVVEPRWFSPVRTESRLPVNHVVSFRRRPGPPRLVSVARSASVGWLLTNSFNHFKNPAIAFRVATGLATGAGAWLLEYEDAFEAAEVISERLT